MAFYKQTKKCQVMEGRTYFELLLCAENTKYYFE